MRMHIEMGIESRKSDCGGKGQLISECLYDDLKFSKKPTKNFPNFCP
jgi:hypothetical protein